jgi:hypothetical protein
MLRSFATSGFCILVIIAGGCTANRVSDVDPEAREEIGYAATARYSPAAAPAATPAPTATPAPAAQGSSASAAVPASATVPPSAGGTTVVVAPAAPGTATPTGTAALAAQSSNRAQVAAVDYPRLKELEILNLTPLALTTPSLWVNAAYVRKLPTIPPQGSVKVKYAGLLQAGQPANDFAASGQLVTKVELQTDQGMIAALGPAIKR